MKGKFSLQVLLELRLERVKSLQQELRDKQAGLEAHQKRLGALRAEGALLNERSQIELKDREIQSALDGIRNEFRQLDDLRKAEQKALHSVALLRRNWLEQHPG